MQELAALHGNKGPTLECHSLLQWIGQALQALTDLLGAVVRGRALSLRLMASRLLPLQHKSPMGSGLGQETWVTTMDPEFFQLKQR